MAFSTAPPLVTDVLISFPVPHVLLITLNRPEKLNALPSDRHAELDRLYQWYDEEPTLRCAVLTGAGRAFCAGADLREWHDRNEQSRPGFTVTQQSATGFGGLSNRTGKKPIVAAVNGLCLGGGLEMVVNCDLVVAAASARFGLPEVTRGVIAVAGALPRITRSLGRQRAAEMALVGRANYTAAEMQQWGIVNEVVAEEEEEDGSSTRAADKVVAAALRLAEAIAANSPDAVIVSREGLRLGWDAVDPERGTELLAQGLYRQLVGSENMREGVRSFVEKRKPVWTDSKL